MGGQLMFRKLLTGVCIILMIPAAFAENDFSIGIRGGYYLAPNWADTYDAAYDNGGELVYGLEFGYRIIDSLEVGIAYDMMSGDGERVWPDESGGFYPSGESVTFDMNLATVFGRYYFMPRSRLSPFLGAGLGYAMFEETDEDSENGIGFLILGGLSWYWTPSFQLMIEGEFSSYPDVIGSGDLSAYFNEDDVGGFTVRMGMRYSF